MKKSLIFLSCFLSISFIYGQNHNYKLLPDKELSLINDLCSTFKDTFIVISPFIQYSIPLSTMEDYFSNELVPSVTKYGFTKSQFEKGNSDTLLMESNRFFEMIHPDSLIKHSGKRWYLDTVDNVFAENYLLYYIEKEHNKESICGFSKPVFSPNGKYAIIEYEIYCGSLCAVSEVIVMRKTKNKWEILIVLQSKMS